MVRALCINTFYHEVAAATAIRGILHLLLVPNSLGFNINFAIFFIVAGIAQPRSYALALQ
jgi:hypothetical protein